MSKKLGRKIKTTEGRTNKLWLSEDNRGFYFLIIVSLFIFISIIVTLPHVIMQTNPKELTTQGIHVQDNQLLDGQGQPVLLHGVDRSGTEYECVKGTNKIFDGPSDVASIQAMKTWHNNTVRIPLNEDCWLGINGANPSGATYRKTIIAYVNLLIKNNIYVILDLHWNATGSTLATGQQVMADKDHSLTFWTSIAKTFKDNNNVIFDLYNEPHTISWSCWRDGNDCNASYAVASMQDMITAVRVAGAKNVLMLGGLDYANDLSGWLNNEPNDPDHNLVASWHMYGKNACDTTDCWDTTVAPVMVKVPVVVGEFGESYNASVCGTKTSNDFMTWMDQHQSSYLAWTWDTWSTKCEDLSLITNYRGTPKEPNGTNYKEHLAKF